eukprot:366050-Chlamydomonas_euryale.AAC.1
MDMGPLGVDPSLFCGGSMVGGSSTPWRRGIVRDPLPAMCSPLARTVPRSAMEQVWQAPSSLLIEGGKKVGTRACYMALPDLWNRTRLCGALLALGALH